VQTLAQDGHKPVSQLSILPEAERELVLRGFNATRTDYPQDALIHGLFERHAEERAEAIALEYENLSLSYGELNARANQLARHLVEMGVKPDRRVAIFVPRGLEMVIALLATLKAGGAYVPLDPSYPAERLAHMLQDSAPVVVLTQVALQGQLAFADTVTPRVLLDEQEWPASAWGRLSADNLDAQALGLNASHLAYIIYTSGSTGKPKGVMIEHQNLHNQIHALQVRYGLKPTDRVLQFAALSFDMSVEEIFGALLSGGALVLRTDAWLTDPLQFCALCEKEQISVANFPTQFWQHLAQKQDVQIPLCLRQIMIGGEAVSPAVLRAWWDRPGYRPTLFNAYGPTEVTVNACILECLSSTSVNSIGRPISNTQIYILDRQRQPVPVGVPGELYLGGAGVARGYLNRADLTAERFITDPFSEYPGARLYRTGDLGCWTAEGTIEFLGRNDHQVKIRGFRIELGEIEAQLSRLAGVQEAVVIAREEGSGEKRLIAYVIPEGRQGSGAERLDVADLRAQLAQLLPAYMVPAAFVQLSAMPLTPNGKLDRNALPEPEGDAFAQRQYEAPEGEMEAALAQIWSDLLKVEKVGRQDNFFDLGGHSLLAVTLLERMRQKGLALEVRTLFAHPHLGEFAARVREIEY